MFALNHITFSYHRKKILKDISLEIHRGDCIALIGANGCGKSTLLSITAGVRKPRNGELIFHGDPLTEAVRATGVIGYVPQDNPLIPDLSVKDNLKLWFHGTKQEFQYEMTQGFLHLLGIDAFAKMQVSKLSGGMKKRVSIGMALQNHPQFLILDEPSAALDLVCKADILSYLKVYLENGGTVLITTHEENELDLCNKIYLLQDGTLIQTNPDIRGEALIQAIKK